MSYVDPMSVKSPKDRITGVEVIFNKGPGEWSVAELEWDRDKALGIRWNGEKNGTGIGNPQSRGVPTWFVIPPELEEAIRAKAKELAETEDPTLVAGYEEMAADAEREREAEEWTEGLAEDYAAR